MIYLQENVAYYSHLASMTNRWRAHGSTVLHHLACHWHWHLDYSYDPDDYDTYGHISRDEYIPTYGGYLLLFHHNP